MQGPPTGNRRLSRRRRSFAALARPRTLTVLAAVTCTALAMLPTGKNVDRTAEATAAPVGQGFTLNASDIRFIRDQIRIAERHVTTLSATNPCGTLLGTAPNQVGDPSLPFGLRTVDGTCNNLQPGQAKFGAADELFPRMLTPEFKQGEDSNVPGIGPVGPPGITSYTQTSGVVVDSQPRTVSNLVVDQTPGNPAAVAAAGPGATPDATNTLFIPNVAPDVGLSAPYNSWFTLFGQFFDHGLDLVTKGGNGSVFMPLQPDDPLFVTGSPTNFMVLTRATMFNGHESRNTTTPFVDQNQTYTSHPSHQVFLREYELVAGDPVTTGRLIDGAIAGNIGNWAEVKTQAANLLGIQLEDIDVLNVPLLATDPYGHFIPGPNGFPQVVFPDGPDAGTNPDLTEGNPGAPISVVGSLKTDHAFLDDIAHNAAPSATKTPDADTDVSTAAQVQPAGTFDDELLDLHFVTGDGRGNENIGLTAVHSVFHAEHNRLVDDIDNVIHTELSPAEITDWETAAPAVADGGSGWTYNERLFQAARFVTEMQYQHLVFEEFGRRVQPQINLFAGYQTEINPAIVAEFAHTVYRFGHSMLTQTVDRAATSSPGHRRRCEHRPVRRVPEPGRVQRPRQQRRDGTRQRIRRRRHDRAGDVAAGRQRARRVRHRRAAQPSRRPPARPSRHQHGAWSQRGHPGPQLGPSPAARRFRRADSGAVRELGRLRAQHQACGVARQLHRGVRQPSADHVPRSRRRRPDHGR